jgi:hypothetical protein
VSLDPSYPVSPQGAKPVGYVNPDPAYPYTVAGVTSGGSEIRKFADERYASAIDDAIKSANLSADQSTAIIVTYKDDSAQPGGGVLRGAVMKRMETSVPSWVPFLSAKKVEWSLAGIVSHDFSTGNTVKEVGAVIRL